MIDIKTLRLLDIAPDIISDDEQARGMTEAIDTELQSASRDIREALIYSRIDELPEEVLNSLAWQFHVDFYEPEKLPVDTKRSLIKSSILWHRKKGTLWAVRQILRDLGLTPVIHEWWEMGAEPYTFGIEAKYNGDPREILTFLGDDTEKLLRLAVEVTKPVRSYLAYLAIIPELPDTGLPEDHACRYDYCDYSHGYWPKPADYWSLTTGEEPMIYGCRHREEIRRFAYPLAPLYGASRYDEFPRVCRRSFAAREHIGSVHITDRVKIAWKRCWLDVGGWIGSWGDDLYRWEAVQNRARIWTFPFALGVYGDGEPLGSLNCCYAPRYYRVGNPGAYGTAKYGGLVTPAEWQPVCRFHQRIIPFEGRITPEERSGHFSSRCTIRAAAYPLAPLYGASRYGERLSAGRRSFAGRLHAGYTRVPDREERRRKRRWIDGGTWEETAFQLLRSALGVYSVGVYGAAKFGNVFDPEEREPVSRAWTGKWTDELRERVERQAQIVTTAFAQGIYNEGEPLGSLNCAYSARYRRMESPGAYGTARYGDPVRPPEWEPIRRFYARVIPVIGENAPTLETSPCGIGIEHAGRTVHTGCSLAYGHEREHPGKTQRFDGKRSWLGRWAGSWSDVDESVCRTMKISVVREEG